MQTESLVLGALRATVEIVCVCILCLCVTASEDERERREREVHVLDLDVGTCFWKLLYLWLCGLYLLKCDILCTHSQVEN